MANNKDPEPKVEFSDNKPLDSKGSSRKWKVPVLIGILTAILLLGAVVSVSVYFSLKKAAPSRLADVNLEEGETLTYRVKQDIEEAILIRVCLYLNAFAYMFSLN